MKEFHDATNYKLLISALREYCKQQVSIECKIYLIHVTAGFITEALFYYGN